MATTTPSIEQRLAVRRRPEHGKPVMYQKWRDLLFVHWEIDPDLIQRTLPGGLTVDTFDGRAYLGVVPFFMCDIRPRLLPAVPGLSNFCELNVRTYVYDRHRRPGVWFYSLDADQWLAVRIARRVFNLPYFDASFKISRANGISYQSHRKHTTDEMISAFQYEAAKPLAEPATDSLEFFLLERYVLFAVGRSNELFVGQVHHRPYPIHRVNAEVTSVGVVELADFPKPDRPPDHAVMSHGVDVEVFPIERIT